MSNYLKIAVFILLFSATELSAQTWKGKWITTATAKDSANEWLAFNKQTEVKKLPSKAIIKIAVDGKYWLWINDSLVVFEGGLKRGPNPTDTYYDEIDVAPYLKKGNNTFYFQLWYFGKDGFSHKNSGKAYEPS